MGEGQIAELVEDREIEADEVIGGAALSAGAHLGLELVHEVDDVVKRARCDEQEIQSCMPTSQPTPPRS